MIDRFGPGDRAFELSCCPGGRNILIFVRARDHKSFPGWGISVIFDLRFLPGGREFDSNFLENVKIPSYAPPQRLEVGFGLLTIIFTLPKLKQKERALNSTEILQLK